MAQDQKKKSACLITINLFHMFLFSMKLTFFLQKKNLELCLLDSFSQYLSFYNDTDLEDSSDKRNPFYFGHNSNRV